MGNPHPTKSKPCKIGRKHTGALSLRAIGRRKSAAYRSNKEETRKWRNFKKQVHEYWLGKRDRYPDPVCKPSGDIPR